MSILRAQSFRRVSALTLLLALSALASSCTLAQFIAFADRPAVNYESGSVQTLRIAVIDETGDTGWTQAITAAVTTYGSATPHLAFQDHVEGANIVMRFRRYDDSQPPVTTGYTFTWGVGGFAAVYDPEGQACNFPPSPLPLGCSGEIAAANIYLNDAIPAGADIEARRGRLILHEMGHAMGLDRHSADLGIGQLALRYGWD